MAPSPERQQHPKRSRTTRYNPELAGNAAPMTGAAARLNAAMPLSPAAHRRASRHRRRSVGGADASGQRLLWRWLHGLLLWLLFALGTKGLPMAHAMSADVGCANHPQAAAAGPSDAMPATGHAMAGQHDTAQHHHSETSSTTAQMLMTAAALPADTCGMAADDTHAIHDCAPGCAAACQAGLLPDLPIPTAQRTTVLARRTAQRHRGRYPPPQRPPP